MASNDNCNGGGTTASAGMEDVIAEMKVHMTHMQTKMNEMETHNISMQNEMTNMQYEMESKAATRKHEIDGMKHRLLEMDELKKENTHLKARCLSLEKTVNVLIKEQKWEYSAPDISDSYWEERDEDYIAEIKSFLDDLKRATCALRKDGIDNNLICLGDKESETALIHDDVLIPHWKELANAMQLYQEEEPLEISIYNLQLTTPVIALLLPMLKHKPIGPINLQNNSFVNVREGLCSGCNEIQRNNTRFILDK